MEKRMRGKLDKYGMSKKLKNGLMKVYIRIIDKGGIYALVYLYLLEKANKNHIVSASCKNILNHYNLNEDYYEKEVRDMIDMLRTYKYIEIIEQPKKGEYLTGKYIIRLRNLKTEDGYDMELVTVDPNGVKKIMLAENRKLTWAIMLDVYFQILCMTDVENLIKYFEQKNVAPNIDYNLLYDGCLITTIKSLRTQLSKILQNLQECGAICYKRSKKFSSLNSDGTIKFWGYRLVLAPNIYFTYSQMAVDHIVNYINEANWAIKESKKNKSSIITEEEWNELWD